MRELCEESSTGAGKLYGQYLVSVSCYYVKREFSQSVNSKHIKKFSYLAFLVIFVHTGLV